MLRRSANVSLLAVVILLLFQTQARTVAPVDQTLIPAGASWFFNDSGADLGSAWRAPAYDDGSWSAGFAQLGYGDGDETTTLGFGGNTSNRYITYYFRHRFLVSNPAEIATLNARLLRDDGAVIYLNGIEMARSNMPTGAITSTTLASVAIGGTDESLWHNIPLDPSKLVAGINVLAVELHQSGPTSTDISFDLELIGAEQQLPPPTVTLVAPADHAISNQQQVTFSASVSAEAGLSTAALYLSGPPLTATFSGPTQIQDAQITFETPATPNGNGLSINVDGLTPHAHGLIRFPTLIGSGIGQVPAGAVISSATLQVNCTNPGAVMNAYRLTQDWVEDEVAWNQRQFGQTWANPGADGPSSNAGVAASANCTSTGWRQIDLTTFVQEWSNGAPNFGVVFTDSGTDGVDFDSSESANSPTLTVLYKDTMVELASQPVSGSSATVDFPATVTQAGTWFWNVRVTDLNGAQSWAAADFEFTMDPAVPDEPVLVAPANGATGVSPTAPLEAMVSTPTGGSLEVSVGIRRAAEDEFTIIALPDTQHYSEAFPAIFTSQTQWIKDNKASRNIAFVTHEGDIVQNVSSTTEWTRANESFSILDGVVPYGMAPGNHDEPSTLYNQFFPYTRYQGVYPWYGGHYQNLNDNNYQLFTAGGMDFVAVHLDFCPTAAAVAWGSGIINSFPNRIAMVTTHAYLGLSAERSTHVCGSTQYLWDGLTPNNPNLHFMLSGHVHGESRRNDVANGHPVFQMLADYQDRAQGGEGWLRILRFVPAEDKVYVQTYSPWLNQYEADADSEFTLDFPMGGTFSTVGITSVPSGSTASLYPQSLLPNTEYEWQVTVTNAAGKTRKGPVWKYTTGNGNQPPVANGDSYSVQSGNTLTTPAPGVLGNDTDPENTGLSAQLVSTVGHGTLSFAANGSFTYTPTSGYVGPDAFTYRVNDGQDWSSNATVNLTVTPPPNQPPVANGDLYSVVSGSTLTIAAPGVLTNDTDPNGNPLTAALVTTVAHGSLSLSANGSFTYTPTAGYVGGDSFTYRANDGQALSTAAASVVITVTAPPPVIVFSADFNTNANGFTYLDNTFRGTTQPAYADGARVASGGYTGGALRVSIGGVDKKAVTNMSGGWQRTFTLAAPAQVNLIFRYKMDQGIDYESDDISQVLASINGVLKSAGTGDWVAQLNGNGNGGAVITTGWQQANIDLGVLPAGTHTFVLGGFNNKKDSKSEVTTIHIDDVAVVKR